jgi:hypothetical protein
MIPTVQNAPLTTALITIDDRRGYMAFESGGFRISDPKTVDGTMEKIWSSRTLYLDTIA